MKLNLPLSARLTAYLRERDERGYLVKWSQKKSCFIQFEPEQQYSHCGPPLFGKTDILQHTHSEANSCQNTSKFQEETFHFRSVIRLKTEVNIKCAESVKYRKIKGAVC